MNVSIENLLECKKNKKITIKGTRITIDFIARFWRMGLSAEEIIDEYPHIPPAGVYAALAYYFANRDEMDKKLDEELNEERQLKRDFMQFKLKQEKEAA